MTAPHIAPVTAWSLTRETHSVPHLSYTRTHRAAGPATQPPSGHTDSSAGRAPRRRVGLAVGHLLLPVTNTSNSTPYSEFSDPTRCPWRVGPTCQHCHLPITDSAAPRTRIHLGSYQPDANQTLRVHKYVAMTPKPSLIAKTSMSQQVRRHRSITKQKRSHCRRPWPSPPFEVCSVVEDGCQDMCKLVVASMGGEDHRF